MRKVEGLEGIILSAVAMGFVAWLSWISHNVYALRTDVELIKQRITPEQVAYEHQNHHHE